MGVYCLAFWMFYLGGLAMIIVGDCLNVILGLWVAWVFGCLFLFCLVLMFFSSLFYFVFVFVFVFCCFVCDAVS